MHCGLLMTALGAAAVALAYATVLRRQVDVAKAGTPHVSQRFDPEGLRAFNAYELRQQTIDEQRRQHSRNHTMPQGARATIMSWEPRILVVDDFLSAPEADELHAVADGVEFRTMAVIKKDGTSGVVDGTATSTIADFPHDHPAVCSLRSRLSYLSAVPLQWYEPLKALNYSEGAYFRGHLDAHPHAHQRSVSRVATAIVYLSDVASGGEVRRSNFDPWTSGLVTPHSPGPCD